MKKFVAVLSAAAMMTSLAACGWLRKWGWI